MLHEFDETWNLALERRDAGERKLTAQRIRCLKQRYVMAALCRRCRGHQTGGTRTHDIYLFRGFRFPDLRECLLLK